MKQLAPLLISLFLLGCLNSGDAGTQIIQENFTGLGVSKYVETPADLEPNEYFTYRQLGTNTAVNGVLIKPGPCDSVSVRVGQRNFETIAQLDFTKRTEACDKIVQPYYFSFEITGPVKEPLRVVAGTRPLDLNASMQMCGGIAAIKCPYYWECKLDGDYPDAGGKCIKVV